LERECKRNVELYWLLNELIPDHNTIANFRRDNAKALKRVFRKMVTMCKRLDLIGGKVIATDGTKIRAQNSKKNNFNKKKIDDHLKSVRLIFYKWNVVKNSSRTDPDSEAIRDLRVIFPGACTGKESRACSGVNNILFYRKQTSRIPRSS
jgi:hypothetical protein